MLLSASLVANENIDWSDGTFSAYKCDPIKNL